MLIRDVLLIYKKTTYDIYIKKHGAEAVMDAIESGDPVAQNILDGHTAHIESMKTVEGVLESRKIKVHKQWRGRMRNFSWFDLIITVGGDGTLLDISHWVFNTPILGINSDTQRSVGKLCAISADELDEMLDVLSEENIESLNRLEVSINGSPSFGACLNDVLFAHSCPSEMTRFQIGCVPLDCEEWDPPVIRSSGLWISTAAGSTAAIGSAGGMPMTSDSNDLQYLIREPYMLPDNVNSNCFIRPNEKLVVVNRTRTAKIWGDGSHHKLPVKYGQTIVIKNSEVPLQLVRKSK